MHIPVHSLQKSIITEFPSVLFNRNTIERSEWSQMNEQRPAWRVNSGMLSRLTGTFRAQPHQSIAADSFDSVPVSEIIDFPQMRNEIFLSCSNAFRLQQPISVLAIAVDEFGTFERNYGKDASTKAIQFIESTICHHRNLIFGKDSQCFIGRYVDNRYLMVLPGLSGSVACEFAEYILRAVSTSEFVWNFRPLCFTVSIGISHKPGHNGDQDMLIMLADQVCDQLMQSGGNRTATAKTTTNF